MADDLGDLKACETTRVRNGRLARKSHKKEKRIKASGY